VQWKTHLGLTLATGWLSVALLAAEGAPRAVVAEPHVSFERVQAGAVIERNYTLRNEGGAPLRLIKADMTPPLRPTRLAGTIAPGAEALLTFRLDTSRLSGIYEGEIILDTDDPERPELHLTFTGQVTPQIEFSPQPMFFVSAVRGEAKTASIEIINHQAEPLEITAINNPSTRFTTELETVEPGQRYRLTLSMAGDGIGGKRSETITLRTSSARYPQLRIAANTLLKERVYTAPETLDFGLIPATALEPGSPQQGMLEQTLMVYQANGRNFELQASSDQPYVRIDARRAMSGGQYQLQVRLQPGLISGGILKGTIRLTTNDPEFPQMEVPFSAILESAR
jgi:hypothetical protein